MIVLFAAKSVVIAGGTLLALRFMRSRSAADRSLIAHLGLAALAALPLGSMLFPPLEVAAPGLPDPATASSAAAWIAPATRAQAAQAHWAQAAADWLLLAYAGVALFLVALMLLSLLRLVRLTARAHAVTDEHWFQAMARARQRMGITKNIALLASPEISSPLSWGGDCSPRSCSTPMPSRPARMRTPSWRTSWRTSRGQTGPSWCWPA